MDIFTKCKRSAVMSRIRSVDTKPEVNLRKALFARGFRFRKNVRGLPGTPDIVLPKHHYVIQVHGCFWHAHKDCPRANRPSSNTHYWTPKLAGNVSRDKSNDRALRRQGWRVRTVWECSISSEKKLQRVANAISRDISSRQSSQAELTLTRTHSLALYRIQSICS